jgi:hypothetical protein
MRTLLQSSSVFFHIIEPGGQDRLESLEKKEKMRASLLEGKNARIHVIVAIRRWPREAKRRIAYFRKEKDTSSSTSQSRYGHPQLFPKGNRKRLQIGN